MLWHFVTQKSMIHRLLGLTAILAIVFFSPPSNAQSKQNRKAYSISTATISGTYFPVLSAMASIVSDALWPKSISFVATKSKGSQENVELLRTGAVDFAVLQGLTAYQAWNGTGPFREAGPFGKLRSVMSLWWDVEQFLIRSDHVRTGDMSDLEDIRGKPVAFGQVGSGTRESSIYIINSLGFHFSEDFDNRDELDYTGAVDALVKGEVAAIAAPGGIPVSAVERAFSILGTDVSILSFTKEQANKLNNIIHIWKPIVIEPSYYAPALYAPVQSISQPVLLVTRQDVPQEVVYDFLVTVFNKENFEKLHQVHRVVDQIVMPKAASERTSEAFPPYHAGAQQFLREISEK